LIVGGIMLGGAAGAVARYVVDLFVASRYGRAFPFGTLVINVTGSGLLGLVTGLTLHHGLTDLPVAVVATGFCGGYTTFSTHAVDTVTLARRGARAAAAVNVAANLGLGTAAAAIGMALGAR
jgi:CrcB protein